MRKKPSVPTIVAFLIIIIGSIWSYVAQSEDYFYTDLSVGYWVDAEYRGKEPDGRLPIVFNFGYNKEVDNWDLYGEVRHRSNIDLGWPVGSAGEDEYSRNGFFLGARYKYKAE